MFRRPLGLIRGMTLREALSQVPDPRARNRQYPLWGLLALILVAFLSRVDSLRGVERFSRLGTGRSPPRSAPKELPCGCLPGTGGGGTGLGGPPGLSGLPASPPGGQGEEGGLGGLLLQPPRCPALPGALCSIAVKSARNAPILTPSSSGARVKAGGDHGKKAR